MAQTILNDAASETLHHLAADIDASLRYLQGDAIDRAHVQRWAEDAKTILAGRVVHKHGGGRRARAKNAEPA